VRQMLVVVSFTVLAGCQHAPGSAPAPATEASASSTRAEAELCTAQRAENRLRAEATRCSADEDCVRVGRYETGVCDGWLVSPDAEQLLRQMRAATDAVCRDVDRVHVAPACPALAATCVAGRCVAKPTTDPSPVVTGALEAIPEDFRCVATGLQRVTAERKLPLGRVELRFPLSVDGSPPRYFEAVGPHDPDAAVAVARALGACRWKLQDGGAIPAAAWGSISITLRE